MRAIIALVLLVLCAVGPVRAAEDPFHSGKPSTSPTGLAIPFGGGLIAQAAKAQRDLNAAISTRFHAVGTAGSSAALAGILLLSFAYGVLHAVGPGHGKMVVASYFVARRERWLKSVLFGCLISMLQGVSAIAIVGILGIVLRLAQLEVLGEASLVEMVSYALIALLGLWMLYHAIAGRAHSHDHHHGDDAHAHAAGARRRDAGPALILAAGLTPCASAVIILLFALANSVFAVGVGAALAMSAGMAITVSAIAILSVLARRLAQRLFGGSALWAVRLERGLAIAGPAVLVTVSTVLFLGAWAA